MIVAVVGLSHKTASLSLRERLALNGDDLPQALAYLANEIGNGVILSTCNRTELYFVAGREQARRSEALRLLAGATGANLPRLERHTYFRLHDDAVRHLHRVAAGLDSMIFGEAEILGQVRAALQAAYQARLCNAILNRLFHSAIRAGRRVHAQTYISRHGRSVSSAAVALAHRTLGELSGKHVLVLGAGEAGTLAARSLVRAGANNVAIANRTYKRAMNLAHHLKATAVPLSQLTQALAETDIVISACGAGAPLVGKNAVAAAMAQRDGRPILLVDIAVPRDIDPAVREVCGVHLYNVDDLNLMCPAGPEERERDMAKAEAIVEEEVGRFLAWWPSLRAVPTIVALRDKLDDVRQSEMAKTFRRFPYLNPSERDGIEALTRAMVKKLLHQTLTRLKLHSEDQDYLAVTRDLFGLDDPGVAGETHEPAA